VTKPTDSYRKSHVGPGIGKRYDQAHAGRLDSLVWDEHVKPLLRELLAREAGLHSASRYLDFACGTGRILKQGLAFFPEGIGVDISIDMLTEARARVPGAQLIQADVTNDSLPEQLNGMFDCVTMFRFLLNAEPELRRSVLKWLAAHMHPGAALIGNNHMCSASVGGLLTHLARTFSGSSKNVLSRKEVESLLVQAGFRIEAWHGFRVLPSLRGKPALGWWLQRRLERVALTLGLGRFGVEQVFVARRI